MDVKTHVRVKTASDRDLRVPDSRKPVAFAMLMLAALMGGIAIGALLATYIEKRQSSPENRTRAPGRGFLATGLVEDATNAAQRAVKLRQFLRQSSQIWKFNRSANYVARIKDLSHISAENPLVVDLNSHRAEARVHELSRRLNVLAIKKENEFNHGEEALEVFVGASAVGLNGVVASVDKLTLPEFRLCNGTCEEENQRLKGKFRHRVGAALMELAMSRTNNLTHFVEAVCPMTDVTSSPAQPTSEFLHGGIPHWAALTIDKPGNLWKRFFTEVMPSASVPMHYDTIWAAVHGLGHAALLVSALRANTSLRAEYTKYHPAWDGERSTVPEAVFLEADSICADGPSERAIFICATGVMHHLIEHASIANETAYDWSYPCDKASSFWTASACFAVATTFIQKEMHGVWRYQKVLAQPYAWSELCLRLSPEHVVRGCIFGLSANMFLLFENGVAEASLEVAGESSASYSDVMSTREELCSNKVLCALDSRERPHATSNGQAIVQWCSRFVANTSGDLTESHIMRFYSCIMGSEWHNQFSNDADLESHCGQLMSTDWQANVTVRSTATSLCIRTFKSRAPRSDVRWPDFLTPTEQLRARGEMV